MAKGRILVVDDEIYIVHILDFSLGMEGYEVITALDGEQALEKARAEKPDLIVLDIMMPKLDGYETCKIHKAETDTKDIPVILLSAKGRNVDQKIADLRAMIAANEQGVQEVKRMVAHFPNLAAMCLLLAPNNLSGGERTSAATLVSRIGE